MRFPHELTESLLPALAEIRSGAGWLLPEIMLALAFLLILALGLFRNQVINKSFPAVTAFTFLLTFFLQFATVLGPDQVWMELLQFDGLARYGALLFSSSGLLTVILSIFYRPFKTEFSGKSEYYALMVLVVLGLNLMAKSVNLLLLFLALETVSIGSYVLTLRLRENKAAAGAALKYLLYGAVASGIMLYGMSFLYGFTQSLQFTAPEFWQKLSLVPVPFLTLAIALTLAGFLFKLAAAPFQFWAPEVYQAAPTPVVAFFSTAPKIGAIIVLLRLLPAFQSINISASFHTIFLLTGGLALLTLMVGNFTALVQTNLKKLLAYSSVAHSGFMLAALLVSAESRISIILFYATVLVFSNFGIFLVVQFLEERTAELKFSALSGLGRQFTFWGVSATVFMVSLTGLPPTGGFTAKLLLFSALWENYTLGNETLLLVLLGAGLLLTGLAFFYYVKLPFYLFFRPAQTRIIEKTSVAQTIILTLLLIPVLLFFFKADWLLQFIQAMVE